MSAVPDARLGRRTMTLRDVDAVLSVEQRAYPWPWTRGNFIDALASGYTAELVDDGDGAIVGYYVAMAGVDEWHLLNITVVPHWQGQGHGSALLRTVGDRARRAGVGSLWLEVRTSNVRARALYERHGFVEVGMRRGYYPATGGREDAIVMRLPLAGPADALV